MGNNRRFTFQDAEDADDDVGAGKVLHCKQNSVMNLVGSLDFLQDTNDQTDWHELTQLVNEIKRSVVDAVPADNSYSRPSNTRAICNTVSSSHINNNNNKNYSNA